MGESLGGALADVARRLAGCDDVVEGLQALVDRAAERVEVADVWLLLGRGSRQRPLVVSARGEAVSPLPEGAGPCTDAVVACEEVAVGSGDELRERWGEIGDAYVAAGYLAAHAFPLGVNGDCVGCLLVARRCARPLETDEVEAARAFAALASVGLSLQRSEEVAAQLQHALDARVQVEQAKGIVAATLGVPVAQAFEVLRGYSRSRNLRISDVASGVVAGHLRAEELAS